MLRFFPLTVSGKSKLYLPEGKNKDGFTLLELLVAITIVSISFMAILPLLWNTIAVNKSMDLGVKAKDLAVQKVEELISLPRDVFDASPYNLSSTETYQSPTEYLTEKGESTSDTNATFQRVFTAVNVPGVTLAPKPVVITSVVTYKYKNETKSRSFSTLWSF